MAHSKHTTNNSYHYHHLTDPAKLKSKRDLWDINNGKGKKKKKASSIITFTLVSKRHLSGM